MVGADVGRERRLERLQMRPLDELAIASQRVDGLLGVGDDTGAVARDCRQHVRPFAIEARSARSCIDRTMRSHRDTKRRPRFCTRK